MLFNYQLLVSTFNFSAYSVPRYYYSSKLSRLVTISFAFRLFPSGSSSWFGLLLPLLLFFVLFSAVTCDLWPVTCPFNSSAYSVPLPAPACRGCRRFCFCFCFSQFQRFLRATSVPPACPPWWAPPWFKVLVFCFERTMTFRACLVL